MDYKQCCVGCRFHFFDEDKCPNCEAERMVKEYEDEWGRQLRLLELSTCIESNDDFWALWYAKNADMQNSFRDICQKVAPEIYDWYHGIEMERLREQAVQHNTQKDLFEPELPF